MKVVPVPFPSGDGYGVALEAVLEVVEDGELVPVHDVRVGLVLHLAPEAGDGHLEDLAYGRILCAVGALTGELQSLPDGRRVLCGEGHHPGRRWDTVRHSRSVVVEDVGLLAEERVCLRRLGHGQRQRERQRMSVSVWRRQQWKSLLLAVMLQEMGCLLLRIGVVGVLGVVRSDYRQHRRFRRMRGWEVASRLLIYIYEYIYMYI